MYNGDTFSGVESKANSFEARGHKGDGLVNKGSFGHLASVICANEKKRFGLKGCLDFMDNGV